MGEHEHPKFHWCTSLPSVCRYWWRAGPFSPSANSRPHHNWTPAIAIILCNTNFSKTFMLHPLDPSLTVSEVLTKPGLISEKNGGPVIKGHVTWSRAHSKRSWTWCRVNGMHIAGRRDLKPASCNRFQMVCVLKQTPVALCNSLRNIVVLLNRWRRACRAINLELQLLSVHNLRRADALRFKSNGIDSTFFRQCSGTP